MTIMAQRPALEDRYDLGQRRMFVGGMQAIVRLLLEQSERDRRQGLNTGGFVSGYRGSPIGRLDSELWGAARMLEPRAIHFQPGVNEELAATAIWGSQQAHLLGETKVDGVFGLWYGKGPGVDRAGDAFKHANFAGTSPHGGVLVLAGDDPSAKSSTTAHQSEQALIASMIPVLVPADLQEVLDFGLIGYAMSRFSGTWIALKLTTAVADASASIETSLDRLEIAPPAPATDNLHVRWPDDRVAMERRLVGPKLDAVRAFARANPVDRLIWNSPKSRIGIVTSGRSHFDVLEVLRQMEIDETRAGELGIRLYKVGLSWPLEPVGALAFAEGLEQILVVEEKRALIESQLKELLYDRATGARPWIVGKVDRSANELIPAYGEIAPSALAQALHHFLAGLLPHPPSENAPPSPPSLPDVLVRKEFFCSGCPHNRSTKVPDGSIALAGIGCHTMASRMPDRRTITVCQMGGEGATWIGQAPFSRRSHVFQNLGDGTYFHSGFLAVRAAIASRVNITYKLLLNDAVAMTGGQPIEGTLSAEAIAGELLAEGVAQVVIVTDTPEAPRKLPAGVAVRPREEMDEVQRELRDVPGVTMLIYQQVCAAEKRRRRKRKLMPDPDRRLFINERVCEGCGDCVRQSSCIAVTPVQTPSGRKRQIDQSACNKDFSCVEGFCPSFIEIEGAQLRKADLDSVRQWLADAPALPLPQRRAETEYRILITGVGGTGVVTVGAVLAMAVHLDGNRTQTLDQTGLAQKNGAVSSHVTIAPANRPLGAVKIGAGQADLLIACDMAAAATPEMLALYARGRTGAILNSSVAPTAGQTFALGADPTGTDLLSRRIAGAIGEGAMAVHDASTIARTLLGDAVFSNMLMLGIAWQKNAIPVSIENLHAAIRLNGASVESNICAFELGRHLADGGSDAIEALLPARPVETPQTVEALVENRQAHLLAYQDAEYAGRYLSWVRRFQEAEERLGVADAALSRIVAQTLAKVMAYKDEYEVARLYSDGVVRTEIGRQFANVQRLKVHLAPPLLSRTDPNTGRPKKRAFGPWIFPAMRLIAKCKVLRGSRFDPFGHSQERRDERRLIRDYEALMSVVLDRLTVERVAEAAALLAAADDVRGFGPVKAANLAAYRSWIDSELARWESPVESLAECEPAS